MLILSEQANSVQNGRFPDCNDSEIKSLNVLEDQRVDTVESRPSRKHSFSRKVANFKNKGGEILGAKGAILLRYIAFRNRRPTEIIKDKRWTRVNLNALADQYPYIGRSSIDEVLRRVAEFGLCKIGEFNRRSYDRTRWYHVPDKYCGLAEEELIQFDTAIAANVGVASAVIYRNWLYWIAEYEKKDKSNLVKMSPSELARLLPFDKSTIKRSLKDLCLEGYLTKPDDKKPFYGPGSKADLGGSKTDERGSNPDKGGSNPDNNMYYKRIGKGLVKGSKDKPAASLLPLSLCENDDNGSFDMDDTRANLDISGFANHIEVGPLAFTSFKLVHDFNDKHPVNDSPTDIKTLSDVCWDIFGKIHPQFSKAEILFFNDLADDADKLMTAFSPRFDELIRKTDIDENADDFQISYYSVLECFIGGFLRNHMESGKTYDHGVLDLSRIAYQVTLIIFRVCEDHREELIAKEFAVRREQLASVDEGIEDDVTLTPAEKMRAVRNGISSRNKVGWIFFDQKLRTDAINVSKSALEKVQTYFEENPESTAKDLLDTMDCCMKGYTSQPAPGKFQKDTNWHVRMGHSLAFFIKYISKITEDLGSTACAWPVFE